MMNNEKQGNNKIQVIRNIIAIVAGIVFIFTAIYIIRTMTGYKKAKQTYSEAADLYVSAAPGTGSSSASAKPSEGSSSAGAYGNGSGNISENGTENNSAADNNAPDADAESSVVCPIVVDFEAAKQQNADIVAWIYCENTVINYPIVRGTDNSFYLRHDYKKNNSANGALFADFRNSEDMSDYNILVYGHHMQDGSMLASLSKWSDQAYYEEHPVMWLLTPSQNYCVELFSEYTTDADSETYSIYQSGGLLFGSYLNNAAARSNFKSECILDPNSHYIVLSTCAYVYNDARTVLHGKLIPCD